MRILIEFSSYQIIHPESCRYFITLFFKIAENQPHYQFIFLVNEEFTSTTKPANVTIERADKLPLRVAVLKKFLLKKSIAKWEADLYLSFNNFEIPSLKIPKHLVVVDLNMLTAPSVPIGRPVNDFRKRVKKTVTNVQSVITISELYANLIGELVTAPRNKPITILPVDAEDSFSPLTFDEKEKWKEDNLNGRDYFLTAAQMHNALHILSLMKSFTAFKKWQQSNMKLVLVLQSQQNDEELEKLVKMIATYKYRNDVILKINPAPEEFRFLLGAAYCFISSSIKVSFPLNIFRAIKSEVPVICNPLSEVNEFFGDTVLYADPGEHNLSSKMQLIYKKEDLRDLLIEKEKVFNEKTTQLSALKLWQDHLSKLFQYNS